MLGERVEAKYSGSDTDSDTEEYCANAHMINPVTGHVEPPRKSPFEGKFIEGFIQVLGWVQLNHFLTDLPTLELDLS